MTDDHRRFNFPKNLSIKRLEPADSSVHEDLEYGIAGRIWEAAGDLKIYLDPPPELEMDPQCSMHIGHEPKTILELGSGTGVAGLWAARVLRDNDLVILTDLEGVVPLLQENVRLAQGENETRAEVWVRALSWGDGTALSSLVGELARDGRRLTHVLCSELVYFPELFAPLLRSLVDITGVDPHIEVVISCRIRDLAKESPFWNAFGAWFSFVPVLARRGRGEWERFASGAGGATWVFVAQRRSETVGVDVASMGDSKVLERQDDTFEMLLYMGLE